MIAAAALHEMIHGIFDAKKIATNEAMKDVPGIVASMSLGAGNAYVTNNVGGLGRVDVEHSGFIGKYATAFQFGQKLGDVGALVTGTMEDIAGGGGAVLSGGAVAPISGLVILHGISTPATALRYVFSPFKNGLVIQSIE